MDSDNEMEYDEYRGRAAQINRAIVSRGLTTNINVRGRSSQSGVDGRYDIPRSETSLRQMTARPINEPASIAKERVQTLNSPFQTQDDNLARVPWNFNQTLTHDDTTGTTDVPFDHCGEGDSHADGSIGTIESLGNIQAEDGIEDGIGPSDAGIGPIDAIFCDEPGCPEDARRRAQLCVTKPPAHGRKTRKWDESFEQLLLFKVHYGHVNVSVLNTNGSHFGGLLQWVKRQRYHYKLATDGEASPITPLQIERLESVGFIWNSHEAAWEEKFQMLVEFERVHKHCNVPRKGDQHKELASWVKRQRGNYQAGKLEQSRAERLDQIGFVWDLVRRKAG